MAPVKKRTLVKDDTTGKNRWVVIQFIEDKIWHVQKIQSKSQPKVNSIGKWRWTNGCKYDAIVKFIGSKSNAENFMARAAHLKVKKSSRKKPIHELASTEYKDASKTNHKTSAVDTGDKIFATQIKDKTITEIGDEECTDEVLDNVATAEIRDKMSTAEVEGDESTAEIEDKVSAVANGDKGASAEIPNEVSEAEIENKNSTSKIGDKVDAAEMWDKEVIAEMGDSESTAEIGKKVPAVEIGEKVAATGIRNQVSTAEIGDKVSTCGIKEKNISAKIVNKVSTTEFAAKISTHEIREEQHIIDAVDKELKTQNYVASMVKLVSYSESSDNDTHVNSTYLNATELDVFDKNESDSNYFPSDLGHSAEELESARSNSNAVKTFIASSDEILNVPCSSSNSSDSERENPLAFYERDLTKAAESEEMIKKPSVSTTDNTQRRKWDRKSYCMYCKQCFSNLYKHLLSRHNNESEVAKFMNMEKGSAVRKEIIRKIRYAGNYQHNNEVIETGNGTIIPSKRPTKSDDLSVDEYFPCPYCYGFYKKLQLWRHRKRCARNPVLNQKIGSGRQNQQYYSYLLKSVHANCSRELKENVLSRMSSDAVLLAIKSDKLILAFGTRLYKKIGGNRHLHGNIREKLREMGRFLIAARLLDPKVSSLEDLINVIHFETIVKTVQTLCGYNKETQMFEKPSLALKIGHLLTHCSLIKKGEALLSGNSDALKQVEDFAQLFSMEWSTEISSHALTTLSRRKWNNPQILPLAEDIATLQSYIKSQLKKCIENMQQSADKCTWDELCRLSLTSIILFNRRRAGEAQRLELETYLTRDTRPCQQEVFKSLSKFEQHLMETLTLIETRGKKGRKIAILLREEMKVAVDLLVKYRDDIGVNKDNPYVFARSNFGSLDCQRGCDVIKKIAVDAGTKEPSLITSTHLRKHIATMSQLFNLKENELDQLAGFLGHNIKVHREFYRLPEKTVTLAKISKILLAAEKGTMHKFKGKSLDEIAIDNTNVSGESHSEQSDFEDELLENERSSSNSSAQLKNTKTPRRNRNIHTAAVYNEEDTPDEDPDQPTSNQIHRSQKSKKNKRSKLTEDVETSCDEEYSEKKRRKESKIIKVPWSEEESAAIREHLSKFFLLKSVPGKKDCTECIAKSEKILNKRTWRQVKYFVYNRVKK